MCQGEDDSPELLISDVIEAGDGISNPEAVKLLANEGPVMVEEFLIKKVGVPFARTDDGAFEYAQEGNHSRRRILHSMDTTGKAIEEALERRLREIKISGSLQVIPQSNSLPFPITRRILSPSTRSLRA